MIISIQSSMRNFIKQAQENKATAKYNHAIKPTVQDMTLAVNELNAAKSEILPDQSAALACLNKIISYLNWFKNIGNTNTNAAGKKSLIPNDEEFKALIRTGLFGTSFIESLAAILTIGDKIPQFNKELSKINKKADGNEKTFRTDDKSDFEDLRVRFHRYIKEINADFKKN
ncbi:MAG: hypothetical protein ACOYMA_00385 [Bacteroidia bacterium]